MIKPRFCLVRIFIAGLLAGIAWNAFGQSGIYDRVGIVAGHGSHGSLPEENIDLFTGNVTLRYRDVFLPGPNGFNLEVWRVYNSKVLKDRQSGNPSVQAYHRSWVGIGWTMHMGMVHAYTSNAPVIEFPDGRLETAFPDKSHSGKYMTKDFLSYEKTSPPKLHFQDGVAWTFGATAVITRADGTSDPVRLVTKIENSFGHHTNMGTAKGPLVSTIDRHEEGSSALKEEFLYESGAKVYGLASKALYYVNGSAVPTNYKTTYHYFLAYQDYEAKYLLKLPYIEEEFAGNDARLKSRTTYYYHETGKGRNDPLLSKNP